MNFVFLTVSFLLLVWSRQALVKALVRLTGPKALPTIYFLLFFPGVAIHELSHFLMASLLLVPTGEISLLPDEKRMGSIEIAKTDPVRQSLVGLAPLMIGTIVLTAIFRSPYQENLLFLYLIFSVSNTMFTSQSDRRAWAGLFAWLAIIFMLVYLFGFWPQLAPLALAGAAQTAGQISRAYFLTLLVNLGFILPLYLIEKIRYNMKIYEN